MTSMNLFIAHLDKRVDHQHLREEFEKFGSILSAMVAKDETGASRGYGFVHFAFQPDGIRAMEEMDGKIILANKISVDFANKQKQGTGYSYGGDTTWVNENEWQESHPLYTNFDGNAPQASNTADNSQILDVKQRIIKVFEDRLYTDVVFYPKNSHRTSVSAHRAILAAGSPLFAKMLFGARSEKGIGMKMEVEISNLSFDAFEYIVRYLYTDEVHFKNDALAEKIFDGAVQFQIYSLVERCKSYFELQELTEQNVCSKLQMSMSSQIDVLHKRCIEYIQENTQQVVTSSDFLKCNHSTICTICQLESLNLRAEVDLFHAVMKWSNYQTVADKTQLLEPLVKCFRFLTFTANEFGDVLTRYPNLLTAGDGLKIMLHLSNPTKKPDYKNLPAWTNKNCTKRCRVHSKQEVYGNPSPWVDSPVRRIVFALRSNDDSTTTKNMTELTSMLQLKCIAGFHKIKTIKFAFQGPISDKSEIKNITIKVCVLPSLFKVYEQIEIISSQEVTVPFRRVINVRKGDLIDIEVEAKNIKFYRFLQFDEDYCMPQNVHFKCIVSSRPKCGKLYFIKEVEYENAISPSRLRGNTRPKRK